MSPSTLSYRSSILKLITDPSYTRSLLLAHPLTAAHAPLFEGLRSEGTGVLTLEVQLKEGCVAAQARIDRAAVRLDVVASRVSKEILIITENSTTAGLYVTYYGDKPLGKFCKPKMGRQKTAMDTWADSLELSNFPTLVALAPDVRAAVEEADAAIAARSHARQLLRDFRNVGERRQWVDRMNATRKEVYGQLAKLPHQHPTLPADFADQFFMRSPPRERDEEDETEEPETAEELTARLVELREEAASIEARLAEIAAEELAAKKAAELRAKQAEELAEVEKAAAALAERRATLMAALKRDAG